MINGPSKHLTWKEMACKDGTEYPLKWRNNRAIELAEVFELIRVDCGHLPITVLSAYRTAKYNKKIGGSRFSQHVQGRALDLRPPKSIDIKTFYNVIKGLSLICSIKGIGKYETFIHVDIRPSDRLVIWEGSGVKDDTRDKGI